MPSTAEYLAAQVNPMTGIQQGSNYVNQLLDQQAKLQAGSAYASGDLNGAASAVASRGDIPGAETIYDQGAKMQAGNAFAQGDYTGAANAVAARGDFATADALKTQAYTQFQNQHSYIQRAAPVFQQIYDQASKQGGPQAGAQALGSAFDTITPDLKQLGVPDAQAAAWKQKLTTDPQGTLHMFSAMAQRTFKVDQNGSYTVVTDPTTGKLVHVYQEPSKVTLNAGQIVQQVGGDGASGVTDLMDPQTQAAETVAPSTGTQTAPAASTPAPNGGTTAPLGIRSNNPGNLQPGGKEAAYTTPYAGILAASANLDQYAARGLNTVAKIVSTWAPPTDANGKPINNTPAYIQDVAAKLGVDPNQPLNLSDHNVKGALLQAIFQHENGTQPNLGGQVASAAPSAAPQATSRVLAQGLPKETLMTPDQLAQYHALPGSTIGADGTVTRATAMNTAPQYSPDQLKAMAYEQIQNGGKPLQGRDQETNRMVNDIATKPVSQGGIRPDNISAQDWASLVTNSGISLQGKKQAAALLAKQEAATAVNEGTVNNSINILTKLLPVAASKGQFVGVNDFEQWLSRQTNDPNAINLKNAVDSISNEYARVMTGATNGSASSDSARAEAANRILLGYNQGSLPAVLGQMKAEMAGRSQAQMSGLAALTGNQFSGVPVPNGAPQPAPASNIPTPLRGVQGLQFSPSRQQYRDASGKVYDKNGNRLQ